MSLTWCFKKKIPAQVDTLGLYCRLKVAQVDFYPPDLIFCDNQKTRNEIFWFEVRLQYDFFDVTICPNSPNNTTELS